MKILINRDSSQMPFVVDLEDNEKKGKTRFLIR